MTHPLKLKSVLLGATAAILLSMAPVLAATGYEEMYANVKNELDALQVPTNELGALSVTALGELAILLDSSQSTTEKQDAAHTLFRNELHPSDAPMNTVGAVEMETGLKADLEAAGLQYPSAEKLTFAQVQQLVLIFESADSADRADAAAVLEQMAHPSTKSMAGEGAMEMMNEVKIHLESVGLKVPADNMLSFQQVVDLAAVWDQQGTAEDHASAAKLILGIN